ncbi:MAG: cysteine synthase A [Candidatus Eremiobacteraeota bacterium]|nr:cysteine synthase A [Candidatus Eremiobacteraeota bacterium]
MLSWQRPAVSSGSAVELQQEPPWSRSDVHRTVPKPSLAADTRDIRAGFVGTIGDTPLIALPKLSAALGRTILGKAEYLNPGGSVKDRAARGIIEDFERRGLLAPGGTVVEGTAGNTGIGLALVGNARGYRTVIVMPDDQAPEKYALLRVYGAELHVVESAPFTNEEKNYYHVARRIAASIPGAVWANQFENTANRDAHERTTGPEIVAQTRGELDAFVTAAGTGGTIAGVGRALKAHDARIRVVLADPYGSALFSYVHRGELAAEGDSIVEGIGIKRVVANFAGAPVDDAIRVDDRTAVEMMHWLLREEGMFVGGSAGLNVAAAARYAKTLPRDSTVVTVLCDGGERYRSRMWNRAWLQENDLVPSATGLSFL